MDGEHRDDRDRARIPARSPWLEQLAPLGESAPLTGEVTTDVLVVGAGIAGASTAFFLCQHTDRTVLLVERGRIGSGATGHNAGQLATYFERPLVSLVEEFGFDLTIQAQDMLDRAWDQVGEIATALGSDLGLERFVGYLGMFTLNHVLVHLRHSALRRQGGIDVPVMLVADDCPFLAEIPTEFDGLYRLAPRAQLTDMLGTDDTRYCAVLCEPCGVGNGALLVQRIIEFLSRRYPGRFRYCDETMVTSLDLHDDHAVAKVAGGSAAGSVRTGRVVLCTNGYLDHEVANHVGEPIDVRHGHHVHGTVGYMAGFLEEGIRPPIANSFIRNLEIGQDTPYVYVTRRRWGTNGPSLVCFGGPEDELFTGDYDADVGFPADVIEEVDRDLVPLAYPTRPVGVPYDFAWHGLMAYRDNRVRLVGAEPRNPILLYNLGCNGVGFMASIVGGHRIARLVRGDQLPTCMWDPPAG